MSLKTVTGLLLGLAFAAMVATGFLFAARPGRGAGREEYRASAKRLLTAVAVGTVALAGAGIGSILLVRSAREEYRVASRRNLESLVSGVRSDNEAKDEPEL